MTTPSDDAARPVPVQVVLPADPVLGQPEQEVVARPWRRRQTETGWVYLVGLPSYRNLKNRMNCTECNIPHVAATLDTAGRSR
ncbi:hypothetical protein [Streptomyces albidoflavus]|uniref:hypothetical protein n=1 Tax=Streptomyces albidoflavus TaxID=1886 RepID=UPI0038B38B50|nr:hypothetical protein OG794_29880 [Streptomyces albidoflavus]WTC06245.1 hypothetical protein OG794_30835 [Streptomyces albidoflavus]